MQVMYAMMDADVAALAGPWVVPYDPGSQQLSLRLESRTLVESMSRTASAVARRSPRCACGSICANSSLNTCQGRFELASDIVERFTGVAPR